MTRCKRVEREGLLQRERGQALDDHYQSCADCQAEFASFEELEQALRKTGAAYQPPEDWEARTWAAIQDQESRKGRRRWLTLWTPVAAAAAAAILLVVLVLLPSGMDTDSVQLELSSQRGDGPMLRGETPHPGDKLLVHAGTGGARYTEIRIYLNDRTLRLRCSDEPPCAREGDELSAHFVLESVGSYQVLLLASDQPLPDPGSTPNGDTEASLEAGAQVRLQAIRVW